MAAPIIALFNNKGGVGKTSLVYHLAWMYADLGLRILAVDLDPQANLTAAFLDEDRLEEIWGGDENPDTIFGAVRPLLEGVGDIGVPHLEKITDKLRLIPGDLALSGFEDELSQQWPKAADGDIRAFRVLSAFWRLIQKSGDEWKHDLVLIDVGPNLGAINRAALIASDHIVLPLAPDIFSLQGLKNLGPTVRGWRQQWEERSSKNPRPKEIELPKATISPLGYVVISHSVRLDRPVKAYERWIGRIPNIYRKFIRDEAEKPNLTVDKDPNCLAMLKHYRSLMALSQEARKPIFHLQAADGALGAHETAVRNAYKDFENVARKIADAVGLVLP